MRFALLPIIAMLCASVSLHGTTMPFEDSTLAGEDGRFRFRDLERGELRRTIEVGPARPTPGVASNLQWRCTMEGSNRATACGARPSFPPGNWPFPSAHPEYEAVTPPNRFLMPFRSRHAEGTVYRKWERPPRLPEGVKNKLPLQSTRPRVIHLGQRSVPSFHKHMGRLEIGAHPRVGRFSAS
jgi:hypothetical protein